VYFAGAHFYFMLGIEPEPDHLARLLVTCVVQLLLIFNIRYTMEFRTTTKPEILVTAVS
jgi:hypothetical protein